MATRLETIRNIRLEKIQKLRALGIDPYPAKSQKDHPNQKVVDLFDTFDGKTVTLTGRLMSWREHGKVVFGDLVDQSGKIQLFIKEDELAQTDPKKQTIGFDDLEFLDVGDFVQVTGAIIKTKTGQISIDAKELRLLAKAIRPLPEKWEGLKDVEERYRKRYLDMVLDPEVKRRFEVRSKIIQKIREFLDQKGFVEVETPTLQSVYGGGFARPFVTHHNALEADFYLRISDEMYLKRLVVGGLEKVYEITKVFRNEGVDRDHNPEFTMFEAMIAFEDYTYGMDIIEEIVEGTAKIVLGTTEANYQGSKIDFKRPWQRLRLVEAVKKFVGVDPLSWKTIEDARKAVISLISDKGKLNQLKQFGSVGEITAFVFEELVEEKLTHPTIIYDYPIEVSPLAKKCRDPGFTQRFEMFAAGMEFGNNYSELNDPVDLFQRFVAEKRREEAGFEEAQQTDYDYITAIEHGFPPTCGIAIGIDRLVMLMTNVETIKEVIAFPTLKPLDSSFRKNVLSQKSRQHTSRESDYSISPEVKETFPGISFAYTKITGVDIKKTTPSLEKLKTETVNAYKEISTEEIQKNGPINAYREMFKKTGVDYHSRRPSPEALLRRMSQGKKLYTINTAVDAYNLAVIRTGVGLGGFDLNKISEPVVLRFSQKEEAMYLLGDDEKTYTNEDELVYADNEKLLTLDLNYRDIEQTKITEKTKEIILFADGGPGIASDQVIAALKEGSAYIQEFCGGKIGEIVLVQ